jgi:polyhydroxyalkanoic acid synthase PhaR subunit
MVHVKEIVRKGEDEMKAEKTYDPFLLWKEMYDKTESYWGKYLGESMKKEEFSQWLGSILDFNLQFQQLMKEATERYLHQVNAPSKEDVANVASLIINVEDKIDSLDEMVEGYQDDVAGLKRELSKLKSDMKNVDKKLTQILEYFSQQENKEKQQENKKESR